MSNVEQPYGDTPCRRNVDVFDSPYLEGFDALAWLEDNPESADDEDALLQAEIKHNMAHENALMLTKNLCAECPVQKECFNWIMATEDDEFPVYGVVAQLTALERSQLRKRLQK